MKIGVRTDNGAEERLVLAEQIGAHGGSIWADNALPGFYETNVANIDGIKRIRERFEAHNLNITGIGIGGRALKNQLLGLPERDRDIDAICETVRRIGQVYADKAPAESPVIIMDQRITYWASEGWKGSARVPGRGGVLLYDFHASRDADQTDAPAGQVPLEETWARIDYLYDRLVPVAEEAGIRLATHPDDPPLYVYRGAAQALNSLAGFKRLFDSHPSPMNGMLLCLGCMQEANEDVIEVIRDMGERNKIFYVHFRNVRGTVRDEKNPGYTEVFPNEGDMDMVAALKTFWQVGYDGVLVPDHHFGFEGDDEWSSISRAWQVGYISGLIQATKS